MSGGQLHGLSFWKDCSAEANCTIADTWRLPCDDGKAVNPAMARAAGPLDLIRCLIILVMALDAVRRAAVLAGRPNEVAGFYGPVNFVMRRTGAGVERIPPL